MTAALQELTIRLEGDGPAHRIEAVFHVVDQRGTLQDLVLRVSGRTEGPIDMSPTEMAEFLRRELRQRI